MKFISKEAQNLDNVATNLNSTQQPGCVFVHDITRLRDFVQMAINKPFNYHSGLWLRYSHIILSQTCSKSHNESIENSEVDSGLKKQKDFADLGKDAKPVTSFFPYRPF